MMCFNFRFHHIPGKSNSIADCFSRLTRRICEAEHFSISEPILADHATIKKIGVKTKFQVEDPWVERLAKSASLDINYNVMVQYLETKTDIANIPKECELKDMASYYRKLSVCTLKDGHNIILKDNNEILVPEKERQQMMGLAHAENHKGPVGMLEQLRGKVFWPWLTKQIYHMVSRCDPCQRLAKSNIQENVEISHTPSLTRTQGIPYTWIIFN